MSSSPSISRQRVWSSISNGALIPAAPAAPPALSALAAPAAPPLSLAPAAQLRPPAPRGGPGPPRDLGARVGLDGVLQGAHDGLRQDHR